MHKCMIVLKVLGKKTKETFVHRFACFAGFLEVFSTVYTENSIPKGRNDQFKP